MICGTFYTELEGRTISDFKDKDDEKLLWDTYYAFVKGGASATKTALYLGIPRQTVQSRLNRFALITGNDISKDVLGGSITGFKSIKQPLPPKGSIKRYIVTTAQNNTRVHKGLWQNLLAISKYYKAEILVSQVSYNKAKYGKKAVKPGRAATKDDKADLWFDNCLNGHFFSDRIFVAPSLALCGEQNVIPTAIAPLSGFETYPGNNASAVFPHTTISMDSVATMPGTPVKFNYTTGACTLRNYIQKKEGLRAEFYHSYGALLVEVNSSGDWWVRQLNAVEDGTFYDLDLCVKDGKITKGNNVEAINWGDVHVDVIDPVVQKTNWGPKGILDTLKPRFQLLHDVLDFHARNHHNRLNPHRNFSRWVEGRDNVKEEIQRVSDFLSITSYRKDCQSVMVDSNHDNALERWLREADYRFDPQNAEFFLECQTSLYKSIARKDKNFHLVEAVLKNLGVSPDIKFLRTDESFIICKETGGIECGMHGHLGVNGARGGTKSLSKIGKKANTGHTHSAGIIHGLYTAGTCSKLQLDYNSGPSSWSHTHTITYKNGKRSQITMRKNGEWCADKK